MRQVAYHILKDDPAFTALVPAARIKSSSAAFNPPDLRAGKWVMIRMLISAQDVRADGAHKGASSQRMQLWVYDVRGSYEGIDRVLRAARQVLLAAPPRYFPAESLTLQGVEWEGDSQDLPADEYGGIARNGSYRLVGAGI